MNRCILAFPVVAALAMAAAGQTNPFADDLAALTRHPHRLTGSAYGRQASGYIADRLAQIGVDTVLPLWLPTWQMAPGACSLTVDGVRVELMPMRPNITAQAVTPPEGLRGPFLYAGRGELWEYGNRPVQGAIVALEYDCDEYWKRAFAMGASAVVFLGSGRETAGQVKHAGIPASIPRFYAPPGLVASMNLRRDRREVVLRSRQAWHKVMGSCVIGYIAGTDPGFSTRRTGPEMLVLSAAFDT